MTIKSRAIMDDHRRPMSRDATLTKEGPGDLESGRPDRYGPAGPRCLIVEYGSGSSLKTRLLLDAVREPAGYVPLDISREHLLIAAAELAAAYPSLRIRPVCADYTRPFTLPPCEGATRTVVYFP